MTGADLTNALQRALAAIEAERLACATLADEMADRYERNALALTTTNDTHGEAMRNTALALRALASAIRARGNHP